MSAPPGRVRRIDTKTGRMIGTIHHPAANVGLIALSPDGTRLAGSRKNGASVWEIATGKEVLKLEHPGFASQCVAFAPDGKTIVTNADFGG